MKGCLAVLCFVGLLLAFASGKYVPTPGGYIDDSCLHYVPSGSHVFDGPSGARVVLPDGTEKHLPECRYPYPLAKPPHAKKEAAPIDAHGWQVWASFQEPNNDTFSSFLGYFNVPEAPPSWPVVDDSIIYYFTGLQNENWVPAPPFLPAPPEFDIIQPVVQYGAGSVNGGGEYWGVANWYVTVYSGALWSDTIKLQTGQQVFGNMTQLDSDTWFIGSLVVNNGQYNNLTVSRSRLASQPWAYVTLEIYNIYDCSWLPAFGQAVNFTSLSLLGPDFTPITAEWQAFKGDNPCGNAIQVESPETVVIQFRQT